MTAPVRNPIAVRLIHGSEDRLGAQAPPDWQKNAVFYDKSDVEALFADKAFVAWRDKFGPTGLSLVSCQVSAPSEDCLAQEPDQAGGQGQAVQARPGRGVQADDAVAVGRQQARVVGGVRSSSTHRNARPRWTSWRC